MTTFKLPARARRRSSGTGTLKLVSKPAARQPAKPASRAAAPREARDLYVQLERECSLGHAAQRTVARARRAIVEVQCHAKGLEALPPSPQVREPATPPEPAGPIADLSRRLDDIHQRLLHLSSEIELEMDRLDVVSAAIDDAVAHAHPRPPIRKS